MEKSNNFKVKIYYKNDENAKHIFAKYIIDFLIKHGTSQGENVTSGRDKIVGTKS